MILTIAWKNVWRNKIRSLVVIIAVLLGIFGGIMATGIMQGWISQKIYDVIHNETSHVQIHSPEFMLNEEVEHTVNNYHKIICVLDTIHGVDAYSERIKVFSMAQTDWAAGGLILKGINPEFEKKVSEIHKHLIEGEYFENKHRIPSIVIGGKAAENLKLLNFQLTSEKLDSLKFLGYADSTINKLSLIGMRRYRKARDFKSELIKVLSTDEYQQHVDYLTDYFSFYRLRAKISVTLQTKDGNLANAVFRVRGVYKTSNSLFDGLTAFVDISELQNSMGLYKSEVHEIAVLCADNETGISVSNNLSKYLPQNSVMAWDEISPEMALFTRFSKLMGYIYVGIILFALAFGIINTMLMSVLERVKELGMLMAIGMTKKRVFQMIMLESVFLSLTGAIIGMIISAGLISYLSDKGLNFSMWADGFEAMGYSPVVYPVVTLDNYIGITIMVILTGILSSIIPALKALKLQPSEALRTD